MYAYTYSADTGGIVLLPSPAAMSKEPRPVYYREMDLLGFDKHFDYEKSDDAPYMWAEANRYIYRGKVIASTAGGSCYRAPALVITEEGAAVHTLERIDIEAMCRSNASIMDALVQETVRNVYNTYTKYRNRVDVFYAAFSGGKDSIVTLDMVQRALPHSAFKVMFGDTGMEFPDTYRTVEKVEEWCKAQGIEFLRARSHLRPEESWRMFGPPAKTLRWCCSVHKTAPQVLLMREITGKSDFTGMAFVGVRGYESEGRAGYKYVSFGEKHKRQGECNPILHWGSAEVYMHIYSAGLILNEAYKKGSKRAGCLMCSQSTDSSSYMRSTLYKEETGQFDKIIRELYKDRFSTDKALDNFMEKTGWGARKNGRDISIGVGYTESSAGGMRIISVRYPRTDWKVWIKTVGTLLTEESPYKIAFGGNVYEFTITECDGGYDAAFSERQAGENQLFTRLLKNVFRKSASCVLCRVCEANCHSGFIRMAGGKLEISDNCIRCTDCHSVEDGCLVYSSLAIPSKGAKVKSKSLNSYSTHGPKMEWMRQYFLYKDEFDKKHSLGSMMYQFFKRFLRDAELTDDGHFSGFAKVIDKLTLESEASWALMLANLVYTPQIHWFVTRMPMMQTVTREMAEARLIQDGAKEGWTGDIWLSLGRFLDLPFSKVGMGEAVREGNKFLSLTRTPWATPDPRVVLYSLYKYSAACGGRVEFTLSRLMECDAESGGEDAGGGGNGGGGVSPALIFGLGREDMKGIITGLTANYGELISSSFTHNLDNVNLREGRTASDVLELF